jgi:hypothetical protein
MWFVIGLWSMSSGALASGLSVLALIPPLLPPFLLLVGPSLCVALGAMFDARATSNGRAIGVPLLFIGATLVVIWWAELAAGLLTSPYDRLQNAPLLILPTIAAGASILACVVCFANLPKHPRAAQAARTSER